MPKPLTSSILSIVILIVLRGGAGAQTECAGAIVRRIAVAGQG